MLDLTKNQQKKYNQIIERLKNKNIRITDIRRAIIKIIMTSNDHLTTQDIIKELEPMFKGVNITSVYNTLDLLLENHILFANTFNGKTISYELATDKSFHLKCDQCGDVKHIEDACLEKYIFSEIADLAEMHNVKLEHFKIEAHGLCEKCK
ncbi:Fur family transcriptional regulator [Mesoplasma photuris]|uniref:Fur family transcriptional regulator n=1 Tax=Mesoplasma photuris TaxID=217731 RepID=UPI0004E0F8F7|nr:Fur family transcriptional regulator [Mesoplasma photuris]